MPPDTWISGDKTTTPDTPTSDQTTTMPIPDNGTPLVEECIIFGDPHVVTFDKAHEDYYTTGEYWLVNSTRVKVQIQYGTLPMTNGLSVTKALAIGGEFLQGNLLSIGLRDDQGNTKVYYNGATVLKGFPAHFQSSNPRIDITYNESGDIMQPSRDGLALHAMHITLPDGVYLQVNEWNEPNEGAYMNIKLRMPRQPNQDGYCGNFNGDEADDERLAVRARIGRNGVSQEDLMFPWQKTVIPKPDTSDCPSHTLHSARDTCRQQQGKYFPSPECLYRECFKLAS
jgi:hypothetical protein